MFNRAIFFILFAINDCIPFDVEIPILYVIIKGFNIPQRRSNIFFRFCLCILPRFCPNYNLSVEYEFRSDFVVFFCHNSSFFPVFQGRFNKITLVIYIFYSILLYSLLFSYCYLLDINIV